MASKAIISQSRRYRMVWKGKSFINMMLFKLFIKACHLLALILVQSFAFNIKDNFWTSTIRLAHCWKVLKLSLQEDSLHYMGVYHRCSVVPNALLGRTVLEPATLIVPDNVDGSGGTVTPNSGFTQPKQVVLGGAPYKFSKLGNNICHRHADGNKLIWFILHVVIQRFVTFVDNINWLRITLTTSKSDDYEFLHFQIDGNSS